MRNVCERLIGILGGKRWDSKVTANYVVYFKRDVKPVCPPMKKFVNVHFKYVTECFFQWMRLKEEPFVID